MHFTKIVEPRIIESDLLNLFRHITANIGRLKNRAVHLRNMEHARVQPGIHRPCQMSEIGLENIDPQSPARLQMPPNTLQYPILLVKGGECQQRVEEDADPVKGATEIKIQHIPREQ